MKGYFLRFFAFILFFISIPALSFAEATPEPLGIYSIPVSYKSLNLRVMGGGTVAADPMPTKGAYPEGTVVHLTATTDTGYNFTGWGDPALGTTTSIDVTMDTDKSLVATFSAPPALHAGDITTIAGNGYYRFAGDGGPATDAYLGIVTGVAADAAGNVYISDTYNNSIRKVDTSGIITTIAGTNECGYSGNGGPAFSARLFKPGDMTADASGNVFFWDGTGSMPYTQKFVRKIDTNGVITTVAGNGTGIFSGDGGPATAAGFNWNGSLALDSTGNLFLPDLFRIRKVDNEGIISTVVGDGTPPEGIYSTATGIAAGSSGNIYFTDYGSVMEADTSGSITTYTDGIGQFFKLALDSSGNLYATNHVTQNFDDRVYKIDPDKNNTLFAGASHEYGQYSGDGGPAIDAWFSAIMDIASDAAGNIYLADSQNHVVRKVDTDGIVTRLAGVLFGPVGDGGLAKEASMGPSRIAFDPAGQLYIVDGCCIRKVDSNGVITTVAGNGRLGFSGDGGPATSAAIDNPSDIAFDGSGNLYIVNQKSGSLRKVDVNGVITTLAFNYNEGYPTMEDTAPDSVLPDNQGNIYIADVYKNVIRMVDKDGIITIVAGGNSSGDLGDGGPATLAKLSWPKSLTFGANGNLTFIDGTRIRTVDADGIISTVASFAEDGDLSAIATDADGNFLVSYGSLESPYFNLAYNIELFKVDPAGSMVKIAGDMPGFSGDGGPATSAKFQDITDIAIDRSGNIFIADNGNNRVRKILKSSLYTLGINSSTGGTASHDPVKEYYTEGENVTITAVPASDLFDFSGWSGDASGTANPLEVTMDGNKTITAQFKLKRVLSLTAGTGGTVVASPDKTATYYLDGDKATITATPDEGYNFTGWSGGATGIANPIEITMDGNKSITASFAPVYQLNVASSPSAGGTMAVTPESGPYFSDTLVSLTANANPGYRFTGWTGDTTGIADISNNSVRFTMGSGDRSLTAGFEQVYTLTTLATPLGAGTFQIIPASQDGNYVSGTKAQIKAIPAPGYMFTGFAVAGGKVGDVELSGDTVNVTMTDNISVTAAFALKGGINLSITQKGTNVTYNVEYFAGGVPQTNKPIKLYAKLKTATFWTLKATVYTSNGSVSKTLALSNGNYNLKAEYAPTVSNITRSNIVDCLVAPVVVPPQGVTNPSVTPDSTPNLQWSAFTGAIGYVIQTCANSTFAAGTYMQSSNLSNVTNADLPELPRGIKRYWRVVAQLPTGWSVPSAARYITYKEGTSFSGLSVNASGNTIRPSVTLVGADGEIPSGKTVTFYYKKGSATTWNTATAVTDVSGFARLASPRTLANGSYQLYVKFAGDASYTAVTSARIPFTLPAP